MAESKPFVTRNEINHYRDIVDRYGVAGAIVVYGKLKEKGLDLLMPVGREVLRAAIRLPDRQRWVLCKKRKNSVMA